MNLIYEIPNELYYIGNFLERDIYEGIHNAVIKERKQLPLKSSKGTWTKSLIDNISNLPKEIDPSQDLNKTIENIEKLYIKK